MSIYYEKKYVFLENNMKRNLLFIINFCIGTVLLAQSQEYQGLLWKISGNGLEKPSYLYGTMHVSNKVAFHLSDSFYKAIESVDVVSLEINPETWMKTMTSDYYVADNMGNAFSMRKNNSQQGFYKSIFELKQPENNSIGSALGAELGILNSLLYRTSNYSADFQEDTYLDLFIFQAGKKQGKEITGLELLGNTMRLNELAAKPENDKKKKKALKELAERKKHDLSKLLDGKPYGEVMENAYRLGDLDLLDSMSRMASTPINHDLIIAYRNAGMADAMDSIMQTKSLFAGVGAAHLANSYGMINLLREKGYTVTSVDGAKSDYGNSVKEKLEETFITQEFTKKTSFDGSFSTYMPGPLYEFPEAGNTMMAAYPDMANGATYVVTRMFTFAPLHGLSQSQYLDKLDSLFFENIPGKIERKDRIEIDGVPGYDILNRTKKGDVQRYHIMVTPIELIIFKAAGKKEFVQRPEVDKFFSEIHFYAADGEEFSPKNTAYKINLPGTPVYEAENNAFTRGYWKKTVQSYDQDGGYYAVMNKSLMDLEFMEEDSFEVHQITKYFHEQFKYEMTEQKQDSFQGYTAYSAVGKKGMKNLFTKSLCVGNQYYLLVALTAEEAKAETFMNSMELLPFSFRRPFEQKHDTARLFDVVTNVEVPAEQTSYYNFYRDNEEEDDSHLEETKTAVYYSKESDETIYARFFRFHKYYFEEEVDSIWNDYLKEMKQNTYFVRMDKRTENNGVYTMEAEVGDTNSGRNILVKHMIKEGALYSLFSEYNYKMPRSKFLNEFYTSLTPWDTSVGTPVIQNKVDMFFANLVSEDSTTREAARGSFDEIGFKDEDVPKMILAYSQNMSGEHSLENRASILDKIGYLKHPDILRFMAKTMKEVGDSVQYQIPILEAIAAQRSKKSARMFVNMLTEETPLGGGGYSLTNMFYSYRDSLELSKEIYPEVLMLASLDEYKEKIYEILASMQDSGIAKPKMYKKYLKQIAWEANNEAKRQQSSEASQSADFYKEESRSTLYGYDDILLYYATILEQHRNTAKAKKFFDRAEKINSPGFKIDLALVKLHQGEDLAPDTWEKLSANKNDRIVLYQRLKRMERLDLFPKKYNHDSIVISLYAQKARINQYRDSLVFVEKHWVDRGADSGYLYFYKHKEKEEDWVYGYLGPIDSAIAEIERYTYEFDEDIGFNKYEDESLQLEKAVRTYLMEKRKRYRVSDEPEFESLTRQRRRFNYSSF